MQPRQRTLADWLSVLESMHPKAIDLGLDRVAQVKQRLAIRFECPVITVGGTNGKGSTCAILESILTRAGYRVGLYTSPHLMHFNERVRVDRVPVSDDALVGAFETVDAARAEVSLTYFEFTTLAALLVFSSVPLDVLVLEVGLGGRLDAVNVIDTDVAIVTSIGIDHTEYLGSTREHIGFEKAGIFRAGKAALCGDPNPPASLVQYAQDLGADFWLPGRDFEGLPLGERWRYHGRTWHADLALPNLRGAAQLMNAAVALAALEVLRARLPVGPELLNAGLVEVDLPGRFQVLPGRPAVILDVAHNPQAAAFLARNLDGLEHRGRTYAVFGAMRDKDIDGIIAAIKARIDYWCVTDLNLARAASAAEIEVMLRGAGIRSTDGPPAAPVVESFPDPALACGHALSRATEDDRIIVFGSFLTVAGVMASTNEY